MNIKPQDGYIFVKETKSKPVEIKEGERELVLPEDFIENPNLVEVVEVCVQLKSPIEKETPMGTVVTYEMPTVKKGDVVYAKNLIDTNIKENGEKYYFVEYSNILGKKEN